MMEPAQNLWMTASELLRSQVSEGVWQSTFAQVAPLELDNRTFTLALPNAIILDRLSGRYRPLVEDAVTEAAGHDVTLDFRLVTASLFDEDIDLRADEADATSNSLRTVGHTEQTLADGIDLSHEHRPQSDRPDHLAPEDPGPVVDFGTSAGGDEAIIDLAAVNHQGQDQANRYTFKNFVTGPSNRFAIAAALSVAERPGGSYNPLFIYGSAGLGKTHILRAIQHFIGEVEPQRKVLYVSTETFLNEFVDSIKNSSGNDFKRRYRGIDVLLVDDIQFIEGKDRLQEELFHTFNDLYGANRQIVLSSDRPPDAIPTLEERLKSRFMMGLLTDIQPPDIETRMAILRKKAERDHINLPNDVSEFIAANITNNIRELEGALNKVTAFAKLNGESMTTSLAQQVLGDFIADRQPRPITVDIILDATVEQFRFSRDELISKSRRRPLVIARQMAMYVTRELTDLSFPLIAREFGGRDHTTVMHACDKISALMKERSQIYNDVMALERAVRTRAQSGDM